MKERFIEFLKRHKAYAKYAGSVKRSGKVGMDVILDNTPENVWIMAAFSWSETADGFYFWNHLNALWLDITNGTKN